MNNGNDLPIHMQFVCSEAKG